MIKFGIIGLGNRGYKYALHTIAVQPECEITVVCDASGNHFEHFPQAKQTTDYRDVLADSEVDAVFIATPDATHAEIVIAAIQAQKHILCEKPLEVTEEKLAAIKAAATDYEKVLEVGYVLRYARSFQKFQQYLADGVIGDLHQINVLDHIPYGGYAYFHDWHRTRAKAQSLLLQKATHSLDIVNWIANSSPQQIAAFGRLSTMGRPGALKKFGHEVPADLHCRACPYSATCEESIQNIAKEKKINWSADWPDQCVFNSEVDVDDHQTVTVEYANGIQLSYQLCLFGAYYQREFHVFGSKGELHFDDVTNEIKIVDRLKNESVAYRNEYVESQMEPGDEEQLADFIAAITTGSRPISNLDSSLMAAKLAIKAQQSIDQKKMITY